MASTGMQGLARGSPHTSQAQERSMEGKDLFRLLPEELIIIIFGMLGAKESRSVRAVSREWKRLEEDWQVCKQRLPGYQSTIERLYEQMLDEDLYACEALGKTTRDKPKGPRPNPDKFLQDLNAILESLNGLLQSQYSDEINQKRELLRSEQLGRIFKTSIELNTDLGFKVVTAFLHHKKLPRFPDEYKLRSRSERNIANWSNWIFHRAISETSTELMQCLEDSDTFQYIPETWILQMQEDLSKNSFDARNPFGSNKKTDALIKILEKELKRREEKRSSAPRLRLRLRER